MVGNVDREMLHMVYGGRISVEDFNTYESVGGIADKISREIAWEKNFNEYEKIRKIEAEEEKQMLMLLQNDDN